MLKCGLLKCGIIITLHFNVVMLLVVASLKHKILSNVRFQVFHNNFNNNKCLHFYTIFFSCTFLFYFLKFCALKIWFNKNVFQDLW